MSTAGRINKPGGPKFIPKRKNAAPSTNKSSKEQSKSVTPRQPYTPLPPLEQEDSNPNKNLLSPPRATTSQSLPAPTSNSSPGSLFGPSDPSLRFSQVSSPSSTAQQSQPFSSFAFTPRDPSATQATSVGPSSQPPNFGQNSSSPQAGSSQLTRQSPNSAPSQSAASGRVISIDSRPASGQKGKGKGKGTGKGKGKEKEKEKEKGKEKERGTDQDLTEGIQEDIQVNSGGEIEEDENRVGSRRRTRSTRNVGKQGKDLAIDVGDSHEGVSSDAEAQDAPFKPTAKAARRPSQPRKRAAPKNGARKDDDSGGAHGENGQSSSEDEYDKIKPKKRRARAAPKRGKVDEMLFGDDNSNEDDGSEGGEEDVEAGSDGEPSKRRKKRSKKADEPLPTVDPSQTTMSQLADPNLRFDLGRPSERTLFFEKQKVDRKTALKLKRQKMKARQKRKEQGLNSDSEDEPVDETGGGGDTISAGNGRGKGKGRAMEDGLNSRETSPQVLDAAKAMALIGGIRDMDQDEEDVHSAGSQHGDSTTTNAIAGPSTQQHVKDGEDDDEMDDGEDDYGDLVETSYAPQMRIVNGQLVIDEESLQIDRSQPTDTGPREIVEESAQDRFVNSRSFSKKPGKAKKWSLDETERFYDALSQFGTDFELISALFPGRNRREIKLKWTKEDKINSKKITAALMQRKKIDLDSYSKLSGQDLSGPMPDDPMDEINERRAKLEAETGPTGNAGHRRGNDAGQGNLAEKKGKGKKKKGPIDEAGAELFDEENIRREQEEAEAARIQAEIEEEERQAAIDAAEASD